MIAKLVNFNWKSQYKLLWLLLLIPLGAVAQTNPPPEEESDTLNWARRIFTDPVPDISGNGVEIAEMIAGRRPNGDSVIYFTGKVRGNAALFGPDDEEVNIPSIPSLDHYLFGVYDLKGNLLHTGAGSKGGSHGSQIAAGYTGSFYTGGFYGPNSEFSAFDILKTTTGEGAFIFKHIGYQNLDWSLAIPRHPSFPSQTRPVLHDIKVLPDNTFYVAYQYRTGHSLLFCGDPNNVDPGCNETSCQSQCTEGIDNVETVTHPGLTDRHTRLIKVKENGNNLEVLASWIAVHPDAIETIQEIAPYGDEIVYTAGYPDFVKKLQTYNVIVGGYPQKFEELGALDINAKAVAIEALPDNEGIVVLAQFEGAIDFDPEDSYEGDDPTSFTSRGGRDLVILHYDKYLKFKWGSQVGGPGEDLDGRLTLRDEIVEISLTAGPGTVRAGLEPRDRQIREFTVNADESDILLLQYRLENGKIAAANHLKTDGIEQALAMASYEGLVTLIGGQFQGSNLAIGEQTLMLGNGAPTGFVSSIGRNDTAVVIHVREATATNGNLLVAEEVELWGLNGKSVKKRIDDDNRAVFLATDIDFDVDQIFVLSGPSAGSNPLFGKINFSYKLIDKAALRRKEAYVFVHNDLAPLNPFEHSAEVGDTRNPDWDYRRYWRYDYNKPGQHNEGTKQTGQEENFFQTSMLIPPFASGQEKDQPGFSFQNADKDKKPVLFVHGVTGTDGYWGAHDEVFTEEELDASNPSLNGVKDYAFASYPGRLRWNSRNAANNNTATYDCWEYYYPPDQDFLESGFLLASAIDTLLSFYQDGMHDKVTLIAHSMGGLVSRAYIEEKGHGYVRPSGGSPAKTPVAYNDNVDQVLFLGTPHHGSFSSYTGYFEPFISESALEFVTGKDGDAPAFREMTPGSASLLLLNDVEELNRHDVTYAQVSGTTSKGLIPGGLDFEAADHTDGVVSMGSANLLEYGVEVGYLAKFAHNHLNTPEVPPYPLSETEKWIIPNIIHNYIERGSLENTAFYLMHFDGTQNHYRNVPATQFPDGEAVRFRTTTPLMTFNLRSTGGEWIPEHTRYDGALFSPYLGLAGKGTIRFEVNKDPIDQALLIRPEILYPQAGPQAIQRTVNFAARRFVKKKLKIGKIIKELQERMLNKLVPADAPKHIKDQIRSRLEKKLDEFSKEHLDALALKLATPTFLSFGDFWYYSQGNFSEKEYKRSWSKNSSGFFPFSNQFFDDFSGIKLVDLGFSEENRQDLTNKTMEILEELVNLDELGDFPDLILQEFGHGWSDIEPGEYGAKMVFRIPDPIFSAGLEGTFYKVKHKDKNVKLIKTHDPRLELEWTKATYNKLFLEDWMIKALKSLEITGGQTYADSDDIPRETESRYLVKTIIDMLTDNVVVIMHVEDAIIPHIEVRTNDGSSLSPNGPVEIHHDPESELVVVEFNDPTPGEYEIYSDGKPGVPMSYGVGVYRDIQNPLYISIDSLFQEEGMVIRAHLDDMSSVTNVTTFAYFYDNQNNVHTITLNDDGVDGDAEAGDGIHAGTFIRPEQETNYTFHVNMFGEIEGTKFSRSTEVMINGCNGYEAAILITDDCTEMYFEDMSSGHNLLDEPISTDWNFGDGHTAVDQVGVSHGYEADGIYTITMTSRSQMGCVSTITQQVEIVTAPENIRIESPGTTAICEGGSATLSITPAMSSVEWFNTETSELVNTEPEFVVTEAGNYYAVGSTPTGCQVTSESIEISEAPAIPSFLLIHDGPLSFCPGGSVTLNVPFTDQEITWSTGDTGNVITVSESGHYTASYINENGCTVNSLPIIVTVYDAPGPAEINTPHAAFLCTGDQATLTIDLPDNVMAARWYQEENPGSLLATGSTFTADRGGTYYVEMETSMGCIQNTETQQLFFYTLKAELVSDGPTQVCSNESDNVTLRANITQATFGDPDPFGVPDPSQPAIWKIKEYSWYKVGNPEPLIYGEGKSNYTVTESGDYYAEVYETSFSIACSYQTAPINVSIGTSLPPGEVSADGPLVFCEGTGITTLDAGQGYSTYTWNNGATGRYLEISTLDQSGDYFCIYNEGETCTSQSNTVNVTVDPIPDMTFSYLPHSSPDICLVNEKSYVIAQLPDGPDYIWYEPGNPTPIQTGGNTFGLFGQVVSQTLYAEATSLNGCKATSEPITLNIHPEISAGTISSNISGTGTSVDVCNGTVVILTASAPNGIYDSYEWSTGATTQSITAPVAPGIEVYTVDFINSTTGCRASASYQVNNLNSGMLESLFRDQVCRPVNPNDPEFNYLGIEPENASIFDAYQWMVLPYIPQDPSAYEASDVAVLEIGDYVLQTTRYATTGEGCTETITQNIPNNSWVIRNPSPGVIIHAPDGSIVTQDVIISLEQDGPVTVEMNPDTDGHPFDRVNWFGPGVSGASDIPFQLPRLGSYHAFYTKRRSNPFGGLGCLNQTKPLSFYPVDFDDDGDYYCSGSIQTFEVTDPTSVLDYEWVITIGSGSHHTTGSTVTFTVPDHGEFNVQLTATTSDDRSVVMDRTYLAGPCTTRLQDAYCGYIASDHDRTIYANEVEAAIGYAFRFVGSGIDETIVTGPGQNLLRLSQVPSISCTGSYDVSVKPIIENIETDFGAVCGVEIRPGTVIQFYDAFGQGWNHNFIARANGCADSYRWTVRNTSNISPPPQPVSFTTSTNVANINELAFDDRVLLGDPMEVKVQLIVGGVVMPFSNPVLVNYDPMPETSLTGCHQTIYRRSDHMLEWAPVHNGKRYYVRLTNRSTGESLRKSAIDFQTSLNLSVFGDFIQWNTDYRVEILAEDIFGNRGDYGTDCTLSIEIPQSDILDSCPISMTEPDGFLTADDGTVGGFETPDRYEWSVHLIGTVSSHNSVRVSNLYYLSYTPDHWELQEGNELNIRVRNIYDGDPGPWSDACRVTIVGQELRGKILTKSPFLLTNMKAFVQADDGKVHKFATPDEYRWSARLSSDTTYYTEFNQQSEIFYPSSIPWIQPGMEIEVRVQYRHGKQWCEWSEVCMIKTPLSSTEVKGALPPQPEIIDWKIYPNPLNNEMLQIQLPAGVLSGSNSFVEIVNMSGLIVRKLSLKDQQNTEISLDLSDAPIGLYFVKLSLEDTIFIKKLVIRQ